MPIEHKRTIAWFSCGAASAIASRLCFLENPQTIVARCVLDNEHPDNGRFAKDVAAWIGITITELRSSRYIDCWDLWERRRYLNGPSGALCTVEMKKRLRQEFSGEHDTHIFGFTFEEEERSLRFQDNNPGVIARFPLIEQRILKSQCYEILQHLGIRLPEMYRLGYHNANCVGCVKGGAGYWNKIRVDFPAIFHRMASLESRIGAFCIRDRPLRTLPPNAGTHTDLELPDCGFFCEENTGWARKLE